MKATILALAILTLLLPSLASAATITVSGSIRYWDSRTQRDNDSKVTGSGNFNAPARRVKLYLYDRDGYCTDAHYSCGETDDDLLGTTYTNATTGTYSFSTTDIGYDVYLVTKYESDDTEARSSTGGQRISHSDVRFTLTSNLTKNWNITCDNDAFNNIAGRCDNADDVNMYFAGNQWYANALASGVDLDWAISDDSNFHPNGHSGRAQMRIGASSNGSSNCDYIQLTTSGTATNHSVAHELGHLLHRRMLDVCDTKISWCEGGHEWNSVEGEMCATSEGFAEFVVGVTHWDKGEPAAWVRSPSATLEGHTTYGNSAALDCVNYSSIDNEGMRGNVARFFWDLFDSTTVDDTRGSWTDNTTWSFDYILEQWEDFGIGTGNGDRREDLVGSESTWPGNDGRNVRDYYGHASGSYSEMGLNCLDDQRTD